MVHVPSTQRWPARQSFVESHAPIGVSPHSHPASERKQAKRTKEPRRDITPQLRKTSASRGSGHARVM
ncbi:hypothetical protein DB32_002919 [Sandaracinus amylolyticus]|uniref:Uncharacterized protein n=1 Tax=Sandaracinus amylolyticus TaxID=927083 RepID=A0A0F6YJ30_9BACT|nr:hypothetical protein DB32_002919 [Sandaracinus amylolyticus]